MLLYWITMTQPANSEQLKSLQPPNTGHLPVNFDEARVPAYTLPPLLVTGGGQPVTNAAQWRSVRRPELMRLFETHVYGRSAPGPGKLAFDVTAVDPNALNGLATRKEVTIHLTGGKAGPCMYLLIYSPNAVTKPAPAFLGLNFRGNHSVHADPGITISTNWVKFAPPEQLAEHGIEGSRGSRAERWQVEKILGRGYALVTAFYGDLEPDSPDGWQHGIRGALQKSGFAPDDWGAIGAWAWGLSRALDYLETDPSIDVGHVAVMGHSRLGKTALWAGAQDERFALVISNNSGCGGAALSRRCFGETVARINTAFPHWFCRNFTRYNDHEADLPVDQHMLVALMAPRPVYVASAAGDLWADPLGEFLSARNAGPVYHLLGLKGLETDAMPAVNQPVGETVGYHVRTGPHNVTAYDWEQYLDFADRHFAGVR
jgi:hypothetical protein